MLNSSIAIFLMIEQYLKMTNNYPQANYFSRKNRKL